MGDGFFQISTTSANFNLSKYDKLKEYTALNKYIEMGYAEGKDTAFDKYMLEGGMSGSYLYKEQENKFDYIENVYDTLILRDIRQKYRIKNPALMDRISGFLMDNVSNLASARSIADTLTSNKDKINHKTVGNYLDYLCNAFAFYKFRRYDIKGKKYLTTNDKYYLSDHTFRYAKLGTKNLDSGRVIENIVAMELLRRGYEVYTGVLYKKKD